MHEYAYSMEFKVTMRGKSFCQVYIHVCEHSNVMGWT